MKISFKKKELKSLSNDKSKLLSPNTPNVFGGNNGAGPSEDKVSKRFYACEKE
ncbi:hypothetical protein NI389_17685 (plasmid) [Pseudoalteromonas xiamenensis]|uniref:hypothetical protein n=1 Tax=Pseudoalteromonas xiamenensis TaxID=882626 RepID=UPI0027E44A06|nr:hypothetical protein [Pseudoalteromonas xiamenensis]WMN61647.1 hypothetical protein NI389_17685 [Pseudoalteromonas xiamenensis]